MRATAFRSHFGSRYFPHLPQSSHPTPLHDNQAGSITLAKITVPSQRYHVVSVRRIIILIELIVQEIAASVPYFLEIALQTRANALQNASHTRAQCAHVWTASYNDWTTFTTQSPRTTTHYQAQQHTRLRTTGTASHSAL